MGLRGCETGWGGERMQGSSWDGEKVRNQRAVKETGQGSGPQGNKGKGGGRRAGREGGVQNEARFLPV